MNPIQIHPNLRYFACPCGTRGDHIIMPGEAILDLSASGDTTDSDAYWAGKLERPGNLSPERLRAILKEYGAWDETELEDDAANWWRAIWLSAGNAKENATGGIVDICEPETEEEDQALVEAFLWTEEGKEVVDEVTWLVAYRIKEDLSDDEFEEMFGTAHLADPDDVWKALELPSVRARLEAIVKEDLEIIASGYLRKYQGRFFSITGTSVEAHADAISDEFDLTTDVLRDLMQDAAKEAYKARRKQDIRKLCFYMGVGHVAETAAIAGIDRVPKILALAGR